MLPKAKKEIILVTFILFLVSFGVSLTILKSSLWFDESFSVLMVKYPWREMFYRLSLDVHPPFYYIIFKIWTHLFSNSVLSLRLFSLLSFLFFLWVWFVVLRKHFDFKESFFILLIISFCPFLLLYAQEGRMYTLGLLLLVLAIYFFIKFLESEKIYFLIFFGVFVGICALTHYFLLFSLAGLFLFSLWVGKGKRLKIITAWILGILIFSSWIPQFFHQFKQVEESYWIPPFRWYLIFSTLVHLLIGDFGTLFFTFSSIRQILLVLWSSILLILVVILFGFSFKEKDKKFLALNWFLFLTPFILAILLSFRQSLYLDRYFVFSCPFYLTILGIGILKIRNKFLKLISGVLLGASLLGGSILFWQEKSAPTPGIKGAIDFIKQNYKEEKIIVTSSFIFFSAKYYLYPLKAYLYAPGGISHFAGAPLLEEGDILKEMPKEKTLWIISTSGFSGKRFSPQDKTWFRRFSKEFLDFNPVRGKIFVDKYLILN